MCNFVLTGPGHARGLKKTRGMLPLDDDRASAVGGVSVRQVPLTSVMDGVMTRTLLPLALSGSIASS